MPTGGARIAIALALAGNAALLGVAIFQLHGVEQRLIVQGQQIRALGEATERLSSQGVRVSGTAGSATPVVVEDPPPPNVLHPEVPNFLQPRDSHWPAPGATVGGTLYRGWASGDPKGFNTLTENAADLPELIETYCNSYLASRNEWTDPTKYHGELATRVEITDDFKEFTIYLRRGVKWQVPAAAKLDGRHAWLKGDHEFTARDVVFTFDMVVNPQVENGHIKSYYTDFEGAKAVNDYTVVVRWKKKQFGNVEQTLYNVYPVPRFLFAYDEDGHEFPKETIGLRFNQHWYNNKGYVGLGAYRMASYEPGTRIRLVANESYWGEKPAIKELVYPIYTDVTQSVLKLKAHELSIAALQPGQYREEIKQFDGAKQKPASPFLDGRILHHEVQDPTYYYLGWNADKPYFADKRVRRAMTMAFNRRQIIDSVFVGLGTLTTGPYLKASPYTDPDIKPIPFDLEGAKKLLADAGWTDTNGDGLVDKVLRPGDAKRSPFVFTMLSYAGSKEWTSLVNILKEDLLKVGVKMNIDSAEWSLMQKRMEDKDFDAYTGGWGLPWESDLYQIWHSSQADAPKGSNRVGFRNKAADKLIETLRETFDPAERVRLSRQLHRLIDDEQPYSFFREAMRVYATWNDVKDVQFAKVRPVVNTLPWSVARGPG